jgi:protein-tyrosine phosphatase
MVRVLFVCLGNICRSPMAEGVFQHLVGQAGLDDKIQSDSAGTSGWHAGERAHQGTLRVLKANDIAYNGRSRQVRAADFNDFDYIVAMDRSNLQNLNKLADGMRAQVYLFMADANAAGTSSVEEVPDPYYTGKFDEVYALVTTGAQALLDKIRREHDL